MAPARPAPAPPLVDLFEQQEEHDPAEHAAEHGRHPAGAGAERDDVEGREEQADDHAVADAEQIVAGARRLAVFGLVARRGRVGVLARWRRLARPYSHSIVPGGLLVMSSTTRWTSRISLIMREAICSSRSYGSRAQSAVIASSDVTARIATT